MMNNKDIETLVREGTEFEILVKVGDSFYSAMYRVAECEQNPRHEYYTAPFDKPTKGITEDDIMMHLSEASKMYIDEEIRNIEDAIIQTGPPEVRYILEIMLKDGKGMIEIGDFNGYIPAVKSFYEKNLLVDYKVFQVGADSYEYTSEAK
jgi:hypothetical protein